MIIGYTLYLLIFPTTRVTTLFAICTVAYDAKSIRYRQGSKVQLK